MTINKVHCLFEQSGTFKNEFIKLGYKSYDYDIKNDYNQTDYKVDLFYEIKKAYECIPSIFDNFNKDDLIFAFFPCIRFSHQFSLTINSNAKQFINLTDDQKIINAMNLHDELNFYYSLFCKLMLICYYRGLKIIIENPYRADHYLARYFPIKPTIIDTDRRLLGDYYEKPTQYFFINCKPSYNLILEGLDLKKTKFVSYESKNNRSIISPDYANRFIREFIL